MQPMWMEEPIMYFPYLRGRQFELIAIRELIENKCISDKIIPIIEPVRASSTLLKTITQCKDAKQPLAFIINPHVGTFISELKTYDKRQELVDAIKDSTIKACIVDKEIARSIQGLSNLNTEIEDALFIHERKDFILSYLSAISGHHAKYNLLPDDRDFRRNIRDNRVLLSDSFRVEERNSDYSTTEELFSLDPIYYESDGYIGFSDYSVVGNKYSEAGFAPYCLVIHFVYFDSNNQLMIRHFKSSSNEDATDPANKFREALEGLLNWANGFGSQFKFDTYAMGQFKKMYEDGSYPGLGTIKKLSIMHQIELINKFLTNTL